MRISIQLQLMREGNDATSAEIARIEKLIETTKQKDEEYKRQLRQFIDYAPFAITGKLFKETRDQIEYDFKLREAKNDQLSRNLVVSQIASDLMLMFLHRRRACLRHYGSCQRRLQRHRA